MCEHKELSLATSSDWESVCAECGEVMENTESSNQTFWFVSGEHAMRGVGVTVLEAWQSIIELAKTEPVPAWIQTDKLEAWTASGDFLKVQNWAEWSAELAAADLSDETCECGACEGIGTVVIENRLTTDAGTKFARTDVELLRDECPVCEGRKRLTGDEQRAYERKYETADRD